MKCFNRLAHREHLVLVAIAASALTMQAREHVPQSSSMQAGHASEPRICEPSSLDEGKARMVPADCGIRADMRPHRARAVWI